MLPVENAHATGGPSTERNPNLIQGRVPAGYHAQSVASLHATTEPNDGIEEYRRSVGNISKLKPSQILSEAKKDLKYQFGSSKQEANPRARNARDLNTMGSLSTFL